MRLRPARDCQRRPTPLLPAQIEPVRVRAGNIHQLKAQKKDNKNTHAAPPPQTHRPVLHINHTTSLERGPLFTRSPARMSESSPG